MSSTLWGKHKNTSPEKEGGDFNKNKMKVLKTNYIYI